MTINTVVPEGEFGLADYMNPGRRHLATHAIAAMGPKGLELLQALFSGAAVNQWGIPFLRFGECVNCGVISARIMGPAAKPLTLYLEAILSDETSSGRREAAAALGHIGDPTENTIQLLAGSLLSTVDTAYECAASLISLGVLDHPEVVKAKNTLLAENTFLSRGVLDFLSKTKAATELK